MSNVAELVSRTTESMKRIQREQFLMLAKWESVAIDYYRASTLTGSNGERGTFGFFAESDAIQWAQDTDADVVFRSGGIAFGRIIPDTWYVGTPFASLFVE